MCPKKRHWGFCLKCEQEKIKQLDLKKPPTIPKNEHDFLQQWGLTN